jgi:hypothetical protein
VIQASANVALLKSGRDTSFAYWLRVSTLEARQPIFLPVQLAANHQCCLAGKRMDSGDAHAQSGWLVAHFNR